MNIDMHNHYVPYSYIKELKEGASNLEARLVTQDNNDFVQQNNGAFYPAYRRFYDIEGKVEEMYQKKIDMSILSVAPPLFSYWTSEEISLYIAQMVNDELFTIVRKYPDYFLAMATVPLNNVEQAILELERSVNKLGIKAVEIGTTVNGELISSPKFHPFFKKAEELDVFVFVHPYLEKKEAKDEYYLSNFIYNPFETARTMANFIFNGFIERFPKIKICFAHGGGFLPYQIGRLNHGYETRPRARKDADLYPSEAISKFYFDSLIFDYKSLDFLVKLIGADNIMMGSDSPFGMSDSSPVTTINQLLLSEREKEKIKGDNVLKKIC